MELYKQVVEYIKETFDDYTIQGIALDLEDHLRNNIKKEYTPLQLKRMEFNRMNKRVILERDAYRCKQCGSYKNLHVDHIIPLSRGGTNDDTNLQTLCGLCNLRKSNKVESPAYGKRMG